MNDQTKKLRERIVALLNLVGGSMATNDLKLLLKEEGFDLTGWQRQARRAGARPRLRRVGEEWRWHLPASQIKTSKPQSS